MSTTFLSALPWPLWHKLLFRFFFLLFCWQVTPFFTIDSLPGAESVLQYVYEAMDAVAGWFNEWLFHIPAATKTPNGNGDYPEQWMNLCTGLVLAFVGTFIWSLTDRKRASYSRLQYWLCLGLRYFLITNGLSYGIIKLFGLQMPFPSISQLATPLGDYLPMRFCWMFIGYSASYQAFSGFMEVLVAALLLFRRTATLGVLAAVGVFGNVVMLNLSYDIPVKINAIQLVAISLFLLTYEMPRLITFFFRDEARASNIFIFPFSTRRARIIARTVKWVFLGAYVANLLFMCVTWKQSMQHVEMPHPVRAGLYDVLRQTVKGDTIDISRSDSLNWQNIVFDRGYEGSVKTTDSRFRQRYGRGYFSFAIDSAQQMITLKKTAADTVPIVQFRYLMPDSITLELRSVAPEDSVYLLLRRRIKAFPLSEKQFHWISETNR